MAAIPAGWGFAPGAAVPSGRRAPFAQDHRAFALELEADVARHERIPTAAELIEQHGMDRSTAFRWRRRLQDRFTGRLA